MKFRPEQRDSFRVSIFKLFYWFPIVVVLYIPYVFYLGITDLGNPFKGLIRELIKKWKIER